MHYTTICGHLSWQEELLAGVGLVKFGFDAEKLIKFGISNLSYSKKRWVIQFHYCGRYCMSLTQRLPQVTDILML